MQSADAVVLSDDDGLDVEHPSEGLRGVYIDPGNGTAFPGGIRSDWRAPS